MCSNSPALGVTAILAPLAPRPSPFSHFFLIAWSGVISQPHKVQGSSFSDFEIAYVVICSR